MSILYLIFLVVIVIWAIVKGRSRPKGKLIYSDTDGNGAVLVDYEWGLKGKPDQIWLNNGRLSVIEIKSTNLPYGRNEPYYSHKMQLATYMRLAEVTYKLPIEKGVIRYANGHNFPVKWDSDLKKELWETIEKMRKVDDRGRTYVEVKKSQCQKCYYYSVCNKKRFAKEG